MCKLGCITAMDFSKIIEKLNTKVSEKEEQQKEGTETCLVEQEEK